MRLRRMAALSKTGSRVSPPATCAYSQMVYHAVSSPPYTSISGTTSSPDQRSPRQEERHIPVPPHLAEPPLGQEPVHGFPDMPFGDPTPRGGKTPGKWRGSL